MHMCVKTCDVTDTIPPISGYYPTYFVESMHFATYGDLLAFLVFVLVFELEATVGWGNFTCCGFRRYSAALTPTWNLCIVGSGPP